MIAGKPGRPPVGLVAPTGGAEVPAMPVVAASVVPDGKVEFGIWPGWKLTKVALAPTTLPTTLLAPLETVAFDTDVLIDPKLRAAIPPTTLFPPEPGTGPKSKLPNVLLTKLSETLVPGLNGALPGPPGGLPGPDAGPPRDANADSEMSPPLMPTNPPMMLFEPVLVTGPIANELSTLPANTSPASFLSSSFVPPRPP